MRFARAMSRVVSTPPVRGRSRICCRRPIGWPNRSSGFCVSRACRQHTRRGRADVVSRVLAARQPGGPQAGERDHSADFVSCDAGAVHTATMQKIVLRPLLRALRTHLPRGPPVLIAEHSTSAFSEGSGRRPHARTSPQPRGPASGSLRRRNPRKVCCDSPASLYGDCDSGHALGMVRVKATLRSAANVQLADLARLQQGATHADPRDKPRADEPIYTSGRGNSCGAPKETVQALDFVEHHRSALERGEVRHNLILAILDRACGRTASPPAPVDARPSRRMCRADARISDRAGRADGGAVPCTGGRDARA
jgi:hypothetical protein